MTTSEPALLDTNVLVNSLFEESDHFAAARALVQRAKDPQAGFRLLPQNVTEFYAVVTTPRRVTVPKSANEALSAIRTFLAHPGITLLPVPTDVVSRLLTLLDQHLVTRGKVHDVHLVLPCSGTASRASTPSTATISLRSPSLK